MEEGADSGVVLVVLGHATVDVGESRSDPVLVALERHEVDGVGEVRGEQLVTFGFQPGAMLGEVCEFLVAPVGPLVERGREFR